MALKKKKSSPAPNKKNSSPAPNNSPRKTRSMTSGKRVEPPAALPKARSKKSKVVVEKGKAEAEEIAGAKGKAKKGSDDAKGKVSRTDSADGSSKNIIIEACKQCRSFKERAEQVKDGLESALTDITVEINPVKPRMGCFEIREASGEVFLSLQDMKRPFKPMKSLDMEQVIKDVIEKVC